MKRRPYQNDIIGQLMTTAEPTREVMAWDRHCRIRYAKAMQRESANS
jgi:hypothetical protein